MFEVATGRELSRLPRDTMYGMALSPDGKLLVKGSGGRTAGVFVVATGKEVFRLPQMGWVSAATFSPDGKLLATASEDDKTARVFDAATGREIYVLTYQTDVSEVAFSSDGAFFVSRTGSADYDIPHESFAVLRPYGSWLHLYQRSGKNWRPVAKPFPPSRGRLRQLRLGQRPLPALRRGCPRCLREPDQVRPHQL